MKGLRKRPTYNELIEQAENSDDIIKKYPDRRATFMRNHPYLTTLDGENFMEALNMQQNNMIRSQQKDLLIRDYASANETSHLETKSMVGSSVRYDVDYGTYPPDYGAGSSENSFRMTYNKSNPSVISNYSVETKGGTRYSKDGNIRRPIFLPRESMSEISAISGRNSEEKERAQAGELIFEPSFDYGDAYGSIEDDTAEALAIAAMEIEEKKQENKRKVEQRLLELGSQTAGAASSALAVMGHGAYGAATRIKRGVEIGGDALGQVLDTAGGVVTDLAGNIISTGLDINQRAADAINAQIAHEMYMYEVNRRHDSMMRTRYPTHGVSSQYNPAQLGYIPMVQNQQAAAEAQTAANMSLNSSSSSVKHKLAIKDAHPVIYAYPAQHGRRKKEEIEEAHLMGKHDKPRSSRQVKSTRKDEDKPARTTRSGKKY